MVEEHQVRVYLSLGTNRGDREENLAEARQKISSQLDLVASSPIYETEPWGFQDQDDFLNQVVEVKTDLAPQELLAFLKGIEKAMGRTTSVRFGPRVIDMDILYYGDRVLQEEGLEIPHPRISERAFVLVPLADLAPEFRSPRSGMTIREMLEDQDAAGVSLHSQQPQSNSGTTGP